MLDRLKENLLQRLGDPYEGFKSSGYYKPRAPSVWTGDSEFLPRVIETVRPKLLVEVGSWLGLSTINMATRAKEIGLDMKIICVDTWLGAHEWFVSCVGDAGRDLNPVFGYPSVYYSFISNVIDAECEDIIIPFPVSSNVASKTMKELGMKVNAVYIDAAHDYRSVLGDVTEFYDLLDRDKNFVIFGDDYDRPHFPGVNLAVDEFFKSGGLELKTVFQDDPKVNKCKFWFHTNVGAL